MKDKGTNLYTIKSSNIGGNDVIEKYCIMNDQDKCHDTYSRSNTAGSKSCTARDPLRVIGSESDTLIYVLNQLWCI